MELCLHACLQVPANIAECVSPHFDLWVKVWLTLPEITPAALWECHDKLWDVLPTTNWDLPICVSVYVWPHTITVSGNLSGRALFPSSSLLIGLIDGFWHDWYTGTKSVWHHSIWSTTSLLLPRLYSCLTNLPATRCGSIMEVCCGSNCAQKAW